jgi:hypothetical protein
MYSLAVQLIAPALTVSIEYCYRSDCVHYCNVLYCCRQGRIRGWGVCNDNAYGLAAQAAAAKQLGVEVNIIQTSKYLKLHTTTECYVCSVRHTAYLYYVHQDSMNSGLYIVLVILLPGTKCYAEALLMSCLHTATTATWCAQRSTVAGAVQSVL